MKTENIAFLGYPNTVKVEEESWWRVNKTKGESKWKIKMMNEDIGNSCDEIRYIQKSGDYWFQIIKDNKIIVEIKESICNIYGKEPLPDKKGDLNE